MVTTTPVTTDRVNKVQIDPYDQVFALTQKLINDGLETNWLLLTQADPKFQEAFRVEQAGAGGVYKATLQAPQVMVETGFAEDLSGLVYLMNFSGGTFTANLPKRDASGTVVRDPDTDETVFEKTSFSLKGWSLAFDMQLGMTLVERTSDKYKKLGLKAGEYSLNELSAKFETAVFNPEMCKFGNKSWAAMSTDVQDAAKYLFEMKLKKELLARLAAANTIGYALKTDQPAGPKPKLTFQPNMIQYQTYPYIPPGSINYTPVASTTGYGQLNYLLYAETTDDRPLPPIDQRMIPRRGNWTDGTIDNVAKNDSCDYGSFYMSRANFFDRYLLKKLRKLNRILEPWHTYVRCKLDDWKNPRQTWSSDMDIGTRSDLTEDDSFYDFKKTSSPGDPPVWTFISDAGEKKEADQAGQGGWSAKINVKTQCNCKNTVSFIPGTDLIEVKGFVNVSAEFYWWNYHLLSANEEQTDRFGATIDWSMTLALEAASDGGLQIRTTLNPSAIHLDFGWTGCTRLNDWIGQFGKRMMTALENYQDIRIELANDMAGQQGLVLPAGGVFYFKNPILTKNGELTCSVSYKNNFTPGAMLDPAKPTIINETASARESYPNVEVKPLPSMPGSVSITMN